MARRCDRDETTNEMRWDAMQCDETRRDKKFLFIPTIYHEMKWKEIWIRNEESVTTLLLYRPLIVVCVLIQLAEQWDGFSRARRSLFEVWANLFYISPLSRQIKIQKANHPTRSLSPPLSFLSSSPVPWIRTDHGRTQNAPPISCDSFKVRMGECRWQIEKMNELNHTHTHTRGATCEWVRVCEMCVFAHTIRY